LCWKKEALLFLAEKSAKEAEQEKISDFFLFSFLRALFRQE